MSPATPTDVIRRLTERGETVATCESLTGGMICAALTSVAGSSAVVRGGLITYATDLKTVLAGVDPQVIENCGVVSNEVALAMATGVRRVCTADWGIAVTGVAGPGPQDGVPAGTVWLAVVSPITEVARLLTLTGDRAEVRDMVVREALVTMMDVLSASDDLVT